MVSTARFFGEKSSISGLRMLALGQPLDRRRNGGAEEHGLPRLRAAAKDFFDVRPEADVQHPVGLVEHHEAQVAQHAARRGPIKSITRPGVPTTMSAPWRRCSTCCRIGLPP